MNIDSLIDELTEEGVKKPLPSPYMQTLIWLAPTSVMMVILMYFYGVRPDFAVKIQQPFFIAELVSLFILTITFTIVAFYYSRPDIYQKSWTVKVSCMILPVPYILGYLGADDVMTIDGFIDTIHNDEIGMQCALCITLFTVPPIIALFTMLKLGASVHPGKTGLLAAMASTTLSYAMLRIHEANDNPAHTVIWHILPVMVIVLLGVVGGHFLLKWKK